MKKLLIVWILAIAAIAYATPVEETPVITASGAGRLKGPAGTEQPGVDWVASWTDGDAVAYFYAVEYNGSGPENVVAFGPYYLRANIPKTIRFSAAYVDSYLYILTGSPAATEVICTWEE